MSVAGFRPGFGRGGTTHSFASSDAPVGERAGGDAPKWLEGDMGCGAITLPACEVAIAITSGLQLALLEVRESFNSADSVSCC